MMGLRLVFLDIDGVLNTHDDVFKTGIHTITRELMEHLNAIIDATGAELVISSAWRYMILRGAMELDGFGYLLNTHGLKPSTLIHGCTASDEDIYYRGDQIRAYVNEWNPEAWVVLDDGSDEPQRRGPTLTESLLESVADRWVKTDGTRGLDRACVEQAISLLRVRV